MSSTKTPSAGDISTVAADYGLNPKYPRLISKPELLERLGVSYPTLWNWMRRGTFPRSRQLGGKVAWIESEVEAWIAALPVRRLKGDGW
jgi:predicted DNA-binding transcriptional regulator AlpA